MASSLVPNTVTNTASRAAASRRRKKKRSQAPSAESRDASDNNSAAEWKSEAQQQVYSSRLLGALRMLRLSPPSSPAAPKGGRAVREVADRVLAVTAKGRSSRLPKKPRLSILRLKMKNLPTVQRKARVLGRIVPGCRKQPLPVILEEATDYIAALEMQVRAMSALADLLSGASSSSSAPPT
nr:transcription factor bHLH148-like [Ipomoea batatas]